MEENLHVQLIKQYISDTGYRSFEDVEGFANEIGAKFEDLERAIYDIAKEQPHLLSSTFTQLPHAKIPRTKFGTVKYTVLRFKAVGLVISAVFLSSVISIQLVNRTLHQATNTISNANISSESGNPIDIPIAYAHQNTVDAEKVFSYPAIPVTLKYPNKPKREVFGFFPYWMITQEDKINIQGYTTVALFGLETDAKGNIITSRTDGADPGWQLWNDPLLEKYIKRLKRERINVVITIKAFDKTNIERLVSSETAQKQFISNAIQLMNSKDLDGINIDFEYFGTAPENVKVGFVRLLANLREAMQQSYPKSSLTVDTIVVAGTYDTFYRLSDIADHVDAMVIMGYDVHTVKGSAGPVAPLEGPNSIVGFIESYLTQVSPEKLILAVPYYGYHWPVNGQGKGGVLTYAEAADLSKRSTITWNTTTKTPSIQFVDENGSRRIAHFENSRSLGLKYDLINKKNLKGVGIWAMGYDGLSQDLEKVLFDKFGSENY